MSPSGKIVEQRPSGDASRVASYLSATSSAVAAVQMLCRELEHTSAGVAQSTREAFTEQPPSGLPELITAIERRGTLLVESPASRLQALRPIDTLIQVAEDFESAAVSLSEQRDRVRVLGYLHRVVFRRIDALQQAVLLTCQNAFSHYDLWRLHALALTDAPPDLDGLEADRSRGIERLRRATEELVHAIQEWGQTEQSTLSHWLGARPNPRRAVRLRRRWRHSASNLSQFAAGEVRTYRIGRDACRVTANAIQAIQREHDEVQRELQAASEWVTSFNASQIAHQFPQGRARVLPAEEHASQWLKDMVAAGQTHISADTSGRSRHRDPRRVFFEAVTAVKPEVISAFSASVRAHAATLSDIERCRDVLAFAADANVTDPELSAVIRNEALRNIGRILAQQQLASEANLPRFEEQLKACTVRVLRDTRRAISGGELGVVAYTTKAGWQAAVEWITDIARTRLRSGVHLINTHAERARAGTLRRLGLAPVIREDVPSVRRRVDLTSVLRTHTGVRRLPAIYNRLFSLEPVTDPRFLIGRDDEMEAIHEAHARWCDGERVVVLLKGARGSGKTSLLNCAAGSVFANEHVRRLELCERLRSWGDIEAYLLAALQVPEGVELRTHLRQERRVVVLEEFERSYLRVPGGFDGMTRLLQFIQCTAPSTLWIVVVGMGAVPLLNRAVALDSNASHILNAMALREPALRAAILQRHMLSGLDLQFAPASASASGARAVRRLLGIQKHPADLFFESLYRESRGIFRTAFELWLDCIGRAEDGVVHVTQLLQPDFTPLLDQMSIDDVLRLQAITQHGSLTVEELAEIFDEPPTASEAQMDKLFDLHLIEEEPQRPGYRVRPQAVRFVTEILRTRNLV